MDTNELKLFSTAYESTSFSETADKVFMSPQGVAKAISKIESDLNVQLFTRSKTGIKPTVYAHNLYNKATELDLIFQSINTPSEDTTTHEETISVFSTYGFLTYLGFDFFQSFKEFHPQNILNIVEFPDSALRNMLLNHHANIGFINGPIDLKKYDGFFVARNNYKLLISPQNLLAKKNIIEFSDLTNQSLGVKGKEYDIYNRHLNKLLKRHSAPTDYLQTSEDSFLLEYVARNLGFAIIPEYQLTQPLFKYYAEKYDLIAKDITGVDFIRDIYFAQVLDAKLSPGEIEFREYVRKHANQTN